MITYKWTFSAFDCRLDKELDKVVTNVHWRYSGTDEDGISAEIYGAQPVGDPNPDAFTAYPDIAEYQVTAWMEDTMDVSEMDANIADQIDKIKNPVQVTLPAPFASKEDAVIPDTGVIIE